MYVRSRTCPNAWSSLSYMTFGHDTSHRQQLPTGSNQKLQGHTWTTPGDCPQRSPACRHPAMHRTHLCADMCRHQEGYKPRNSRYYIYSWPRNICYGDTPCQAQLGLSKAPWHLSDVFAHRSCWWYCWRRILHVEFNIVEHLSCRTWHQVITNGYDCATAQHVIMCETALAWFKMLLSPHKCTLTQTARVDIL